MISMKGFFLFIVMNVFTWNSNVYAENIAEAKSIYDLKVITGMFVNLNDYNGQFLLITYELTDTNIDAYYKIWMSVAEKYYKNKLRILFVVNDELNNFDEAQYNHNSDVLEKMIGSKIELVYNVYAQDLRDFMFYKTIAKTSIYNTYFVDKDGTVKDGFLRTIDEKLLVNYLKPWKYIKCLHELEVNNYKGDSIKMEKYKNNIIIVSFITLVHSKNEEEKRFQRLLDVARKTNDARLKILVFLVSYTKFYSKDPSSLISDIKTNTDVQLFQENANSLVLRNFIKSKISDNERYFEDFVIDNKGNVIVQFKRNSSVEVIKKILDFITVAKKDQEETKNVFKKILDFIKVVEKDQEEP